MNELCFIEYVIARSRRRRSEAMTTTLSSNKACPLDSNLW